MTLLLRPYQEGLITGARQHFRAGRKRVIVQLATGAGKTALCARMLHNAASRNKRVWFCVHRRELVRQVASALGREGVAYGLVTADAKMNLDAPAQVCSIPTLAKRLDRVPPPDLIAWDECHHIAAGSWAEIMQRYPDAYHIGLSATPTRLDGAGLANYFDAMVCGPSVKWLIEQGFLSKYRLYAPSTVDRDSLPKRGGEYVTSAAEKLITPRIVGNAISHYRKHCDGARAIAFAVSVEKSKETAALFMAAGIPALHIDGKTDPGLRDEMMAEFQAGKVRVISNVNLFSEGFDCPALEAVIDTAPTASMGQYRQRVGRMLRPAPGKEYGIYLDCVGNSHQHGLPDDDIEWELTTGRAEKKKNEMPAPRVCSYCFAASRAGSRSCRVCGREFPVESREVEQVDGELVPMTPEEIARRQARIDQGRTQDFESLKQLGILRYGAGKGERWAAYVWAGRMKKRGKAA
jgi:superfamily II DNA or RNA helicase